MLLTDMNQIDMKYLKLTGQTPVGERQGMVDIFTGDKDIFVFLLSTRAGGLGLNLMAADTVIIYDQDFVRVFFSIRYSLHNLISVA